MTWSDAAGHTVAWAWRVLARPALDRGVEASQVVVAASILTAGRILKAIEISWADAVIDLGKKKVDVVKARLDLEVEKAKVGANSKRLSQVESAKLRDMQASVRIKHAEEKRLLAQATNDLATAEKAKAEAERLRAEAESIRLEAQSGALERLTNARSRLLQEGASAEFVRDNLHQFIAMLPTLPEPMRQAVEKLLSDPHLSTRDAEPENRKLVKVVNEVANVQESVSESSGVGVQFGQCGGRRLSSKLEQDLCSRLGMAGVVHSHSPRHYEIRYEDNKVAAYEPMIVLRGRGREGKGVVIEAVEEANAPILRKIISFRSQYGQEFYVILVGSDEALDEAPFAAYDESCSATNVNTLIARLAE